MLIKGAIGGAMESRRNQRQGACSNPLLIQQFVRHVCGPGRLHRRVWVDVRFARKNSPEMLRASQRTTTIFWPLSSCFATVLARRPSRWPFPSMTWLRVSSVLWRGRCRESDAGQSWPMKKAYVQ